MYYVGVKCACCGAKAVEELNTFDCRDLEREATWARSAALDAGWNNVPSYGLCCRECVRISETDTLVPDAADEAMKRRAVDFVCS